MRIDFSNKKLFIFDFDGVLVDSIKIKTDAFAELYSHLPKREISEIKAYHIKNGGMSRYEKIKFFEKKINGTDISELELKKISNLFSNITVNKVISAPEITGAIDFIDLCLSKGKICAVNSATPEFEIRRIVESRGWVKKFCIVLGSPNSKEENIDTILNLTNIAKKESIFFGDADSDLKAAKQKDIDFVGVGPWMKNKYKVNPGFQIIKDFTDLV